MNRQAKELTKADLMPLEEYSKNRTNFRKKILEIIYNGGAGHTAGSLSCIDILITLYFGKYIFG